MLDWHGSLLRCASLGKVFRQYGHTVKLMAPKRVTPYRMSGKRGKNDAVDAAAICEAVTRPNTRFVPVWTSINRQGDIEERTATYNQLRGLLSEFDVVLLQSPERLRREIGPYLDSLMVGQNAA
jgi:transposase